MKYPMMRHHLAISLLLSTVLCSKMSLAQVDRPIEFTETDPFNNAQWNSSQVTVLGFKLGMKRSDAAQVAQSRGLSLEELKGSPCVATVCSVFGKEGWTGVDLLYDSRDTVSKISIDAYVADLSEKLARGLIVRVLRGSTQRLMSDYSDKLRRELLGMEDERCVKPPKTTAAVQSYYNEYKYNRLGLMFHVETIEKAEVTSPRSDHIVRVAIFLIPPN